MRIIHYTIGLPPQRSGGLTKYSIDLIKEQQLTEEVFIMYPSGYHWWSSQIKYKLGGVKDGIKTIELKNTFPIPLLFGIRQSSDFILKRKMSTENMEQLYNEIHPDIFHVHTLMGLPKELLIFFKQKGVKLIYSSHDYFGICPKVNFINNRGELCNSRSGDNCEVCNLSSKSTMYLRVRNSGFVLNIKNNPLLRKLLR